MPVTANTENVKVDNSTKKYVVERIDNIDKMPVYETTKRIFDFVFSLFLTILLALPMMAIGIVIRCTSPGPALYKQERTGLNGKIFMIYKFRSMYLDAEINGAQWAVENDERVTKVGRFLRMSRIDELPQLINIFKGDLSFVGPRPERPVFYKKFAEYIDGFEQRTKVVPGLTGLAQVNGGYYLQPEEKIVYDIEYIKTRSWWLDLKLIFKTVAVVFTHDGAK